MFEPFILTPDKLAGPLLAILLQATFLVTERVHERRISAVMPAVRRLPTSTAKGRQFLYWLRRLGLAVSLLTIGHLDAAPLPWLVPGVALFAAGMVVRWRAVAA
jgi:hypothetical protein